MNALPPINLTAFLARSERGTENGVSEKNDKGWSKKNATRKPANEK